MTLLRPEWLWLAALVFPVLLLHLHFRRRRKQGVTSLLVWRELIGEGTAGVGVRWIRDAVAFVVLALALAAFAVSAAEPVTGSPRPPSRHLVIVLDASAGTNAIDASDPYVEQTEDTMHRRYDVLVGLATRAIGALGDGDTVTVWHATDAPYVLVGPTADRASALQRVRESRSTLHPSVVAETQRLARQAEELAGRSARYLVLSGGGPASELEEQQADTRAPRITVARDVNASLVAVDVGRKALRIDYRADAPLETGARTLVLRSTQREITRMPLPAMDERVRTLEVQLDDGVHGEIEVRIEGDRFPADDWSRVVVRAEPALAVGVMTSAGRPSAFLTAALAAMPGVVDPVRSGVLPEDASADVLAQFDVFLAVGVSPPADRPAVHLGAPGKTVGEATLFLGARHPILTGVDLAAVRVQRAMVQAVPPGAQVLVDSSAGPVAVLVRSDAGDVVLVGLDGDDSTLPLEAAFPVLLRNALREVSAPPHVPAVVRAGDPVDLSGLFDAGEAAVVVSGARAGFRARLTPQDPLVRAPVPDVAGDRLLTVSRDDGTVLAVIPVHWTLPPTPGAARLGVAPDGPDGESAIEFLLRRPPPGPPERHWSPLLALAGAALLGLGAFLLR